MIIRFLKKHRITTVLRTVRRFRRNQAGYTLIEMIAVLAISSIIGLSAAISSGQVITQTVRNNDFTTANRQVLNALHWMSRDAQMAQYISGASGFPISSNLTLSWNTWDNVFNQVVYAVEGDELKRYYTVGTDPTEVTMVAQYVSIDPASTNCTATSDELIITLTGTVGEGDRTISITKEKTISPRPWIK
jgi:prepilin-type N-terminal cleavage/methylation domain-containing protein